MRATILLCDFAEELNGKLYIMGGGWSQCAANQPVTAALAIKLAVPWDQANRTHEIKFRLLTEDGKQVTQEDDKPVILGGKVEVGRPPGLRPGTELDVPLAVKISGLTLEPGGYLWEFSIADEPIEKIPFRAIGGE